MISNKIYKEYKITNEIVSYIIGKNGHNIKIITNKVKNGSYIEYNQNEGKFILSAYSNQSVNQLIFELEKLINYYHKNCKKYKEYIFINKNVEHKLVTNIIHDLRQYPNSAFVEYKGNNIFTLSNYSQKTLDLMLERIKLYDNIDINELDLSLSHGLNWINIQSLIKQKREILDINSNNINHSIKTKEFNHTEGDLDKSIKTYIGEEKEINNLIELDDIDLINIKNIYENKLKFK